MTPRTAPSPQLVALLALACGIVVANLYYAQPLIGLIAPAIGLGTAQAGLTVTLTQAGYGTGLLLVASLADLVENRRLVLGCLAAAVVGLLATAGAFNAASFLLASFAVGVATVATQVLVPLASHLAPDHLRGRTVGNVMAGLLAGIMLARPAASLIAALAGWRAVFLAAAALVSVLALVLGRLLPERRPAPGLTYRRVLASLATLAFTEPVLRRRAAYQALMFGAFNLYWTAVPLLLAHRFGFTQRGIALFALAGAGGALVAPVAGRLADRGDGDRATAVAMATLAASFGLTLVAAKTGSLALLVAAAVALDAAVQLSQVCGQRAVYALAPDRRARLNAVYVASMFVGGAAGSTLATVLYAGGGFAHVALAGIATGVVALALFVLLDGRRAVRR